MVDFSPPDSGISPAGFGEGPGPLRKVTGMIFPKKSRVPIWILQVLNRSDVMAQEARSREAEAEWAPQNTLIRDLSENRVPLDVLINYHIYIYIYYHHPWNYNYLGIAWYTPFSLPGQKLEDTSSKTGAIGSGGSNFRENWLETNSESGWSTIFFLQIVREWIQIKIIQNPPEKLWTFPLK